AHALRDPRSRDRVGLRRERDQDVRTRRRRGAGDRPARVVSWQLKGWLGEEWRWHVNKPWDAPGWLPARVPGSVVDDLVHAREVPDPYFERNSRLAEWAAERAWVYRRWVSGDGGVLRFGGVDHACTVLVEGDEIARHDGCFGPFEAVLP